MNLYIYSSFHIALGAALSVLFSYAVLIHIPNSNYPIFVFSSTMLVYCLHRIIGIKKIIEQHILGRFKIIHTFRNHLIAYAGLSAIVSLYFFLTLDYHLQILLILPCIIGGFYVMPLFNEGKRLRDFNIIKIFLISLVWSIVIGCIPYYEVFQKVDLKGILFTIEIFLFIFSITIPFDIRDLEVDKFSGVQTIPLKIGIQKSYILSIILLVASIFISVILFFMGLYSMKVILGITLAYILVMFLILLSQNKRSDYWYSGILDATIHLKAIIGILLSGILSVIF